MFMILKHGGKQYWAQAGDLLSLEKIEEEAGSTVELEVIAKGDDAKLETKTETVKAEIVKHYRDKKVIIFKKIRRHHYSRKKGHKQHLTQVRILAS